MSTGNHVHNEQGRMTGKNGVIDIFSMDQPILKKQSQPQTGGDATCRR